MSAYMINDKTRAIIAKYLAAALNENHRMGVIEGVKKIELDTARIANVPELKECLAEDGEYSSTKIYKALYDLNRRALIGRYGEKNGTKMAGDLGEMPNISVKTGEDTRREWLANLYTVMSSLIYQCDEKPNITAVKNSNGDWEYVPCPFLKALEHWQCIMAAKLAEYVVEEVRGSIMKRKPWDEF